METTMMTGNDDRFAGQGARRMIALDVDGTLVDAGGTMSRAVRRAGRELMLTDHETMIATGRSLGSALPVARELGLDKGWLVLSNGGVTARLDPEVPGGVEIVHQEVFDPSVALEAVHQVLPDARLAIETADGPFLATPGFQDGSFGAETIPASWARLRDTPAVRLVISSDRMGTDDFAERIGRAGLHGVAYAIGWSAWVDVSADGVSKASALERLRLELGIDTVDTVAIGDGRNDLEMLRWAGMGVAMGQAPDDVKAAADVITDSVHDDGAAHVLDLLARESAAA